MIEYLNTIAISIFHSCALIVAALLLIFLALVALIYGLVAWNKKMEKLSTNFMKTLYQRLRRFFNG